MRGHAVCHDDLSRVLGPFGQFSVGQFFPAPLEGANSAFGQAIGVGVVCGGGVAANSSFGAFCPENLSHEGEPVVGQELLWASMSKFYGVSEHDG